MIAVAKKRAMRDRYGKYDDRGLARIEAEIEKRLGEVKALRANLREHKIASVQIDGAGAFTRGCQELDDWIDLVTVALVKARRKQDRDFDPLDD